MILGPGDDAGVYCLNDSDALVQTVDIITPVVDDPYTFGAISAVNSMSDIYAMGGRPISALAIAGFSSCDYEPWVLKEILHGAVDKLTEAGASLIGGHSIEDKELKFWLSVTGLIQKKYILKQTGAKSGDVLILTKPLGFGILTTALKGQILSEEDISDAVKWMQTLNSTVSKIAVEVGAHAVTDITGFGLTGHALNMIRDSHIDFIIHKNRLPVLSQVRDMVNRGMVPQGAYNNFEYVKPSVDFPESFSEEDALILCDPQTSGGLLIAIPEGSLDRFQKLAKEKGVSFWIIGKVVEGNSRIKVV